MYTLDSIGTGDLLWNKWANKSRSSNRL